MNNKISIRFAEEKDLPEIIELCHQHAIYEKAGFERDGKQEKLKNICSLAALD